MDAHVGRTQSGLHAAGYLSAVYVKLLTLFYLNKAQMIWRLYFFRHQPEIWLYCDILRWNRIICCIFKGDRVNLLNFISYLPLLFLHFKHFHSKLFFRRKHFTDILVLIGFYFRMYLIMMWWHLKVPKTKKAQFNDWLKKKKIFKKSISKNIVKIHKGDK